MAEVDISITGRKIFFLYPHSIIQTEAIDYLSSQEYEVYSVNDAEKMLAIIENFPESLLFINIDAFMSTTEWLHYVDKIRKIPELKSTLIGILTNTGAYNQLRFLENQFKPQAGVLCVRSDIKSTLDSIVTMLERFNCHGRRKYVRTYCQDDNMANMNFIWRDRSINMKIRDISTVGLCCFCDDSKNLDIPQNSIIPKTLITLRGIKVICDVVVFAAKQEQQGEEEKPIKTFVFLFTQLETQEKYKIRTYIRRNLHSQIEASIE